MVPLNSPIKTTKRIKLTDCDDYTNTIDDDCHERDTGKDEIPTYLLLDNQSFINMAINSIKSIKTITINDIQQVAFLKHRMVAVSIRKDITETYLRSVKGILNQHDCDIVEIDRRVWPVEVESLMLTHRKSTATTTTTETDMNQENVQMVCENLLQQHLKEIQEQTQQLEKKLNDKTNSLVGFSSMLNETIDHFVENYGSKPLKIKRDFKIAIIKYNYQTEILERKYLYENPNEYQVSLDM